MHSRKICKKDILKKDYQKYSKNVTFIFVFEPSLFLWKLL